MKLSDNTALVWDRGSFLPFAQALGGKGGFGQVLYFSEWRGFAPYSKDALIGRDMENVRRVDSFWDHLDDADVVVFPDVGDGDMQMYLRQIGKSVWGTGRAEMLELDRVNFKRYMEEIGLPVIPWNHVVGMDALENYMRDPSNDDSYIKSSFFRGDLETFHHEEWDLSKPWFLDTQMRLGPHAMELDTMTEKSVPAIEPGYDGYNVDGVFPQNAIWGWEKKDSLYVGKAGMAADMPLIIRQTNAAIGPALGKLGCRGNYHSEVRLADDGTVYLNDPCCRCGSPPHEIMSIQIANWAEIVWAGAHGEVVEPEFTSQYGAQILLRSEYADEHFVSINIPEDLMGRVRLRRPTKYEDGYWHVPGSHLDLIGSALGLGDTPDAALKEAEEVAGELKAYQLDYNKNARDDMLKIIEEGEKRGLYFG